MSRKIDKNNPDLSTQLVDNTTGEIFPSYVPPRLNRAGMECPSDITLTAIPALRDFDLGVRIRRFMSAPQSVQARLDANFDDDNVNFDNFVDSDDANPLSPHELRFDEVRSQLGDKQKARIKAKDDEKAAKLAADVSKFRDLYKTLQKEGAIPPTPPQPEAEA